MFSIDLDFGVLSEQPVYNRSINIYPHGIDNSMKAVLRQGNFGR
jgi:hypothetical protein